MPGDDSQQRLEQQLSGQQTETGLPGPQQVPDPTAMPGDSQQGLEQQQVLSGHQTVQPGPQQVLDPTAMAGDVQQGLEQHQQTGLPDDQQQKGGSEQQQLPGQQAGQQEVPNPPITGEQQSLEASTNPTEMPGDPQQTHMGFSRQQDEQLVAVGDKGRS